MRALVLSAAAVTLSACAGGPPLETTAERLSALEQSCRERGGVLVSSGAPPTGRPEVDNVCRITGGASRLPGG
ncbi:MAG: hypothetical protein A2623_13295 [Caulobacterales bacterium RIFCSPHIGHO2_01_FULL_70_19]|nr:MAG: hypothetical protein A2623_13295 [Caulobacterales bacterium RIFCSPHIGHO2_01_FULL_70_19]